MTDWSQFPVLQALGWAMLNNLWQMALLLAGFSVLQYLVRLSSHQKYYLAVGCMVSGLLWFGYTFIHFYKEGITETLLAQHPFAPTFQIWNLVLSAASLAYLTLLAVPAYRLVKNWRYIEHLKKHGLQKTAMEYRLFVKKTAQRLGIKHTVHVYLSQLVHSPVTIGYIKPIILLPIAAVNSLNPQQVEAILLHELSHIKRYDYFINFVMTLIHTFFYFNPFVKSFVSVVEFEREKCCDELVMQFQYDKISYASALLLLGKSLPAADTLTVSAAGKKHLLRRIEKIVGLEKKPAFTFNQFVGFLASFALVLSMNSLFVVKKEQALRNNYTFAAFENPLYQLDFPPVAASSPNSHLAFTEKTTAKKRTAKRTQPYKQVVLIDLVKAQPVAKDIIQVAYDTSDELVTAEEKTQIAQTIETTKKVLKKTKWNEVEASIGDGMTAAEKKAARHEYLRELEKIDWKTVESHLKSEYESLNWEEIQAKLNGALTDLKLDSLQNTYHEILSEIQKAQANTASACKATTILTVPDMSVNEVNVLKSRLKGKIDSIQVIRQRKVIHF
jgi:bla regulator protein BlaR1